MKPKNDRKYTPFITTNGIKINLRISRKANEALTELVKEGYYLNKNDAIRDSLNLFIYLKPWLKRITKHSPLEKILT